MGLFIKFITLCFLLLPDHANGETQTPPHHTPQPVNGQNSTAKNDAVNAVVDDAYNHFVDELKNSLARKEESSHQHVPLASQIFTFFSEFLTRSNFIFFISVVFRIGIILFAYIGLRRSINRVIGFYSKRLKSRKDPIRPESNTVMNTVVPVIQSVLHWIVTIIAGLLVLSELGVNIMPIIYSFSVIGLAISIGSQTLVKDLINGILTLFEGNIAVGDDVIIASHAGIVESITLRCVHLRQKSGELQTIPFSEVTSVVNRSRDFSVAFVSFIVGFDANLDIVENAVRNAFMSLKNDSTFSILMRSDLNYMGVERITDYGIQIEANLRVNLDPNKILQHAFYDRIVKNLQSAGIPMPNPGFSKAE
jgi:small-conductance mechanosensitive channel